MAITSQYITDDQFTDIIDEQNITGKTDEQLQNIVDRASGDLETELCERFVVPLQGIAGADYSSCPGFALQKITNAMIAKVRQIIGKDAARNIVVDSTQKYIDVHMVDFKGHIKDLLDAKKHFGFQLNSASDGAYDPVQSLGLARADNRMKVEFDPNTPWFP